MRRQPPNVTDASGAQRWAVFVDDPTGKHESRVYILGSWDDAFSCAEYWTMAGRIVCL